MTAHATPTTIVTAADLLSRDQGDNISSTSRLLLHGISVLDHWGAWTWDLRLVGLTTTLILWGIRITIKKYRGVDWYALLHALVSTSGALACIYLNAFAAEALTGVAEPLRSIQCQGPLTSLHRILPAITMGYSLFDLLDGLSISWDFVLHGTATMLVMIYFVEVGAPHIMAPMLFMEASTVFLNVVHADFFSDLLSKLNIACFAGAFFVSRIVVVPFFVWGPLIYYMWQHRSELVLQECFPPYFFWVCFGSGMFYNVLNSFWFIKIVKKLRRKILGQERHDEKNELGEQAQTNNNNKKKRR